MSQYDVYSKQLSDRRLKYIKMQDERSKEFKGLGKKETRLVDIKRVDTINVYGTSVSVYVSYCPFNCKNCFNKLIQDKNQGQPFRDELDEDILKLVGKPFIDNLCLVGGEPFLNAERLIQLVKKVKEEYPNKKVWSYTGFLYESLMDNGDAAMLELLGLLDFLIDGQYIDEVRVADLGKGSTPMFRGSSNQRIIHVPTTINQGKVKVLNTIEELEDFYR